jgi:hypothetical protein
MINQFQRLKIEDYEEAIDKVQFQTFVWKEKFKKNDLPLVNDSGKLHPNFIESQIEHVSLLEDPTSSIRGAFSQREKIYNGALNYYFKEILTLNGNETFEGLKISSINRAILTKDKLDNAITTIQKFGFEQHLGFFIHLICRMKSMYTERVGHYDSPEEKKRRRDFPEQVDTLINIIGWAKEIELNPETKFKDVEAIKFFVKHEGWQTINDFSLIMNMMSALQNYWGFNQKKNWKKNLKALIKSKEETRTIDYYNHNLAVCLYYFLTDLNFFDPSSAKYKNNACLFIAHLFSLSEIPTYKNDKSPHLINVDNDLLVSYFKTSIKRHSDYFVRSGKKPSYNSIKII